MCVCAQVRLDSERSLTPDTQQAGAFRACVALGPPAAGCAPPPPALRARQPTTLLAPSAFIVEGFAQRAMKLHVVSRLMHLVSLSHLQHCQLK